MSIKRRRDAVLKSNISINSIRDSVVKFTKGLTAARQTSSEIVKSTDRNNRFKRTLIGNDNTYFSDGSSLSCSTDFYGNYNCY